MLVFHGIVKRKSEMTKEAWGQDKNSRRMLRIDRLKKKKQPKGVIRNGVAINAYQRASVLKRRIEERMRDCDIHKQNKITSYYQATNAEI